MEITIECPYCKTKFEFKSEGDEHQDETMWIDCQNEECEKTFTGSASWEFSIDSINKSDCLNGGDHVLKKSIGIPDNFPAQYRCQLCDDSGDIGKFKKHLIIKR